MDGPRVSLNQERILKYFFSIVFLVMIILFWAYSYYGGAINVTFGRDHVVHIPDFLIESGRMHQAGFQAGALLAYAWCIAGLFYKYLWPIIRFFCLLTVLLGCIVAYYNLILFM